MADENTLVSIINGGQFIDVDIMALAEIDISGIEENRGGEAAPEGVADWRGMSAAFATAEVEDKEKNSPTFGQKVTRPVIDFVAEAIGYHNVKDRSLDIASLAGTQHRERFFIKDLEKDLGRVKAFMVDIGMTGAGRLQDLLDSFTGYEFSCAVKHRKDKNDTSRVYANFDAKTASPLGGGGVQLQASVQQTAVASAPAVGVAPVGANAAAPAAGLAGGIRLGG